MNVMLLAAGEGTRLRPYTTILPKPAIPFLNVPLAGHALGFLHNIAVDNLVVNTFHLPEKVHTLFEDLPHGAKQLHFSDEKGEILGSGGGLGKARQYFQSGGSFLMMNADEVILPVDPNIVAKALQQHESSGALATLMVMEHPMVGTQFGGVWADENHNVLGFGKDKKNGSVKGWHFIGAQILSERVFNYIPKAGASNILYDALVSGIAQGELVKAFPFDCTWFETGNPHDFQEAAASCLQTLLSKENTFEKLVLDRTLARFLKNKPTAKQVSQANILASPTSTIDASAKISGLICIADNGVVEKNCVLENVIVGKNARVPAGTLASNTFFL